MTTKTLEKTLQKLSREVSTLRSFVIQSVQNEDQEGVYKPAFIKKILRDSKLKAPFTYKGPGSMFLLSVPLMKSN